MGLTIYQSAAVCMCACMHMHACMLNRVHLFATPWTVAHQAPLSMGFSRQEQWSGLPFSPSWDHPDAERQACPDPCHGCSLLQGGPLRRLATSALLMGVVSDKNPSDF